MKDEIKSNETNDSSSANWLRSFKGCENYTDEEATAICESLDTLAVILLENVAQKLHTIDNQYVVYLQNEKQSHNLAA